MSQSFSLAYIIIKLLARSVKDDTPLPAVLTHRAWNHGTRIKSFMARPTDQLNSTAGFLWRIKHPHITVRASPLLERLLRHRTLPAPYAGRATRRVAAAVPVSSFGDTVT